jgi:parallel beta-helix repeat protein
LEFLEDRTLLATDWALNPSRTGFPHPLESDHGWGGGSDQWEIVDGRRDYPEWYHGLAFTGGRLDYVEPAGPRQATIDFGVPRTFQQVILWHHGTNHIPADAGLQYWDGTTWQNIAFSRFVDLSYVSGGAGSTPDYYTFNSVTGSRIRYTFDNRLPDYQHDQQIEHGWLYEFEVWDTPVWGPYTVTNTNDSGPGSLRQAIVNANSHPGRDTITFTACGTINLTSPLPPITDPVVIDGTTAPGYTPGHPCVELNGAGAGAGANGLTITAGNSTVKGLMIDRFSLIGIELRANGGNVIQANYIGTDLVGIFVSSPNNTIGGTAGAATGNLISGNSTHGIVITGSGTPANNNVVQGNYIGTNAAGTAALGHGGHGVHIFNAANNTIGGPSDGARNIISSNQDFGVLIEGANATGNQVQGNYIGTDVTGMSRLGNGSFGVWLYHAPSNTIGGTGAAARNVISGNRRGIEIDGPGASGNLVQGNFVGVDRTGTQTLGNVDHGVVLVNASNNTIGGTTTGAGNVISGNHWGVDLTGSDGNVLQGNYIGTDVTGTLALGNADNGVYVGGSNNLIGGTTAAARNIISSNGAAGVQIYGALSTTNLVQGNVISSNGTFGIELVNGALGNQVQGNYIGTDVTGTNRLGNGSFGVWLYHAPGNTIGGIGAAARNVISGNLRGIEIDGPGTSGNLVQGNFVGVDVTGTQALGNVEHGVVLDNASNNTIGGTTAGAGNVISGNHWGVNFTASDGNVLQGNYIGTDVTGTFALGNAGEGVYVGGSNNLIGGTIAATRNVISGNNGQGVALVGAAGTTIQGNYIGLAADGNATLANALNGLYVYSAASNTIGGTAAGAGNVISGNRGSGIDIENRASANNQVLGNRIGTNADGNAARANALIGVRIFDAPNNTVGGAGSAARNIIAGNGVHGVQILGGANPTADQVLGNFIGVAADGNTALANTGTGVSIVNAQSNVIGGTATGAGNVISGNGDDGVQIYGVPSTNNLVQGNLISGNGNSGIELVSGALGNLVLGNFIGTDATGTLALGNARHGVYIINASNNTIGGAAAGASNSIAFNGGTGVVVEAGINNLISRNAIHDDGGLGIDLGNDGVTPNTPGGPHVGPNHLQNFPVLFSAVSTGSTVIIQGTFNSTPGTTFTLEFFANTSCNPSGYGEGKWYLDSRPVLTDDLGNYDFFTFVLNGAVPPGQYITATATDPNNNTSEFSACVVVGDGSVGSGGGGGGSSEGGGSVVVAPPGLGLSNAEESTSGQVDFFLGKEPTRAEWSRLAPSFWENPVASRFRSETELVLPRAGTRTHVESDPLGRLSTAVLDLLAENLLAGN